ncbi:restriction endonuclease [Morganella morganii]|uniref:restriction endonuclease n=1 Tax=Morganella morganii TaxID=582 RepID=UPI001C5ACF3B|nr:restriction endonuclease [Morganella morganii]MBW4180118.1 restriction endonuclease [Morganella morganii]
MAMNFKNAALVSVMSEAAGFKTGLTLDKNDIVELFPENSKFKNILSLPDERHIRMHSEEVDEVFAYILFKLGSVDSPNTMPSTVILYHKYKDDPELTKINEAIMNLWIQHIGSEMVKAIQNGTNSLDPTLFMSECNNKFGRIGHDIGMEYIKGNVEDMHRRLSGIRRIDWKDNVALKELFKSESLETQYGNFIDQRYINYLQRNTDKLNEMHWRKFEGLTAEYFSREGYQVELGPGRNDGGVDVRIWKDNKQENEPPLILVQCKRYKDKVERAVVKALWADVQWEKANSGLIVTTSGISPGGLSDCEARGYNIKEADRNTIIQWLSKMKEPGTGIFMGL